MGGFGGGKGGMGRWDRQFGPEETTQVQFNLAMAKRIGHYFFRYWRRMLIVLICLGLSALLGLVPPTVTKNIIDTALPNKDINLLLLFILASFLATVFSGLLGVLQNYLNVWISKQITYDMKNQMFRHLERMPYKFFATENGGEIITRMTSDIGGVQLVFQGTIVQFISNVLIFVSTAMMLFFMHWKLAILGMFVIPLFIIPTKRVGKTRRKIACETQIKTAMGNNMIQEVFSVSGNLLMKLFSKEKEEYDQFEKVNRDVTALQIKESMVGRWFMMVIDVFSTIGPMLIYLYGGYLFIQGEVTIGAIVAFVAMITRLYRPVAQLTNIHIEFNRSLALFERIFQYFDMKPEPTDAPGAIELKDVTGQIDFEHVHFSYKEGLPTLTDVSFTISPGKTTALVGPSGSGKSTITNLLLRLYEIDEGAIKLDGKNIKDITRDALRQNISVVTQETYLFNSSIMENLRYANDSATKEQVYSACKAAYIHDFILSLPKGYDTIVGNRGMKLSGGEKQRVSIARAILKNPKIIVLDEATSSLDNVSEANIQQAMATLLKDRTGIVIAHRLSTIISADFILVVENGRVVESGTHETLLNQGGVYTALYHNQIKPQNNMNETTKG